MNTLRIGDLVRVHTTTEALTILALDGEEAWLRDDAGNHVSHRVEDLERAHSAAWDAIYRANEPMPVTERAARILRLTDEAWANAAGAP